MFSASALKIHAALQAGMLFNNSSPPIFPFGAKACTRIASPARDKAILGVAEARAYDGGRERPRSFLMAAH